MMHLKVGSRDSRLAVVQARLLMDHLAQRHPHLSLELVTMKTTGDLILDKTLDKIGGKGLFVKELDNALHSGRVDLTVHSCKDLPMEENPALPLLAFSQREDPRDVLVLPKGVQEVDFSKPLAATAKAIGSSSQRRALQLQALFPQATITPVRGNVQTRLDKLDRGDYGALVLAAAGLIRLGLEHRIARYFTPEEMLPAGGQGILVVQGRQGEDHSYLDTFDHPEGRACALAERAFVACLDGGCSSPVAAFAQVQDHRIHLQGMDAWGNKSSQWGDLDEAESLGCGLGQRMKGVAVR